MQTLRFFDAQDRLVSYEGRHEPRPHGVPDAAWRDPRDGYWKQGQVVGTDRRMVGPWVFWDDDGLKVLECAFDDDGVLLRHRSWHPDGSEAYDVDWVARTGRYRVPADGTPRSSTPHTHSGKPPKSVVPVLKQPLMPNLHPFFVAPGANEVRFVPGHMFSAAQRGYFEVLQFWPSQPRYFDADGGHVEPAADGSEGPPLAAHVATLPHGTLPMWRLETVEDDLQTTRFWRIDGTPAGILRHTMEGGSLRSLELFDDSGQATLAARFDDLPDGSLRFVDATLPVDDGSVTLVGDVDCALVSVTHTAADGTAEEVRLAELESMGPAEFQGFYERYLAAAANHNQTSVRMGQAFVKNIAVTDVHGLLPFTLLARIDYTRALIVLRDGTDAGAVYWVEGDDACIAPRHLMDPEKLLGVLTEKGVDASATVDARVAALVPPANRLASDVVGFVRGITIKPHLPESQVFGNYVRSDALTEGSAE